MEREAPTKKLLIELSGGDESLISSLHHGLFEAPVLANFYPHLNLDELVVFAAQSWEFRSERDAEFLHLLQSQNSIYDIFNYVNNSGFSWLNGNKSISDESKPKYERLNPFKGKNLKDRLERVDEKFQRTLRDRLKEDVDEYVFESQYQRRKSARNGDNKGLVVMNFQPVYPQKNREKRVEGYVLGIHRLLSAYPIQFEPVATAQIPLFQ